MESIAVKSQEVIKDHALRTRALNEAAQHLLQKLIGCWPHDLSRPFTDREKTYRVCIKCGVLRDFTWFHETMTTSINGPEVVQA
jgi:hypothetical protein